MAATKELLQMDLYALLEVEESATSKDIKKAYRQRALKCHPDKNPDNPKAAELFHQLSQALEILTDAAARAAYDKVRAAKRQAEERTRKLDDKRKKIKLDLEAREREAEAHNAKEVKVTRTLEEEIARLREEGSKQLAEEQRLVQEQIERQKAARLQTDGSYTDGDIGVHGSDSATPKLKLKWKSKKEDENNGGYSQEFLFSLLKKYGDVQNVVMSSKKKGSAVVEFASAKAADLAFRNEIGLMGNPLKVSWLEGQPTAPPENTQSSAPAGLFAQTPCSLLACTQDGPVLLAGRSALAWGFGAVFVQQGTLTSGRDYESLVLMRMRQAAERQRLIEEMQRQDEEEDA